MKFSDKIAKVWQHCSRTLTLCVCSNIFNLVPLALITFVRPRLEALRWNCLLHEGGSVQSPFTVVQQCNRAFFFFFYVRNARNTHKKIYRGKARDADNTLSSFIGSRMWRRDWAWSLFARNELVCLPSPARARYTSARATNLDCVHSGRVLVCTGKPCSYR